MTDGLFCGVKVFAASTHPPGDSNNFAPRAGSAAGDGQSPPCPDARPGPEGQPSNERRSNHGLHGRTKKAIEKS